MEGLLTELNYYEPSVGQLSIIDEYTEDYPTTAALAHQAPLEFFVQGADGIYLDLNNSYLQLEVKITMPDRTDLGGASPAGPVNGLLNSLFNTVELFLNNTLVNDTTTKYQYKAYIENLINFNKDIMETRMLCEGWLKDTTGQLQVTDPAGANRGLQTRTVYYDGSRVVTLVGRPHLDLFHQDKLIPQNVDMKIRFVPNTSEYLLKTADPGAHAQVAYRLQILKAHMCVRHKKLAPSLIMGLEKALQTNNYVLNYKKVNTKLLTIAGGHQSLEHQNLYLGPIPDLVILGMVSDANANGGYLRNPFNFEHFGVEYVVLRANGESYPRNGYRQNFADRQYIKSYFSVLEALGYDTGLNCWNITPSEWANGYTFFVFKLSPGPTGTLRAPTRTGSVSLEMRFAAPLANNINILLLSQTEGEVQFNKDKTAIVVA